MRSGVSQCNFTVLFQYLWLLTFDSGWLPAAFIWRLDQILLPQLQSSIV